MTTFTRAFGFLEWLVRQVVLVIYVAVVVTVTFQVVNRFWLQWPIIWLSDFAIICFIWLGFLTAALAVRADGHFRMSLLMDISGPRMRALLELFSIAVAVAIFALLAWTGWEMAYRGLREISPGLQVNMAWAYASVPVSAVIAVLFLIESLARRAAGMPPVHVTKTEGDS